MHTNSQLQQSGLYNKKENTYQNKGNDFAIKINKNKLYNYYKRRDMF